jgi:purine-cytosine permease-like protein
LKAVDLGPVPLEERRQSAFDLFLIFAAANVVATTMVTGASLAPGFDTRTAHAVIGLGAVAGAALVAALVPLGPRLGVPSVIAARAALGPGGAGLLAGLLFVTNFAWIALNNVIAASACSQAVGGSERAWAVLLGLAATAVVAAGPGAVGRADRIAVPTMLAVAAAMTARATGLSVSPAAAAAPPVSVEAWRGLDVVIGYQASWILMFADYSRYCRPRSRPGAAVFLALSSTSAWFMALGFLAARAAGSGDPGAMLAALGLGGAGALLMAVATVTTNFVNVYLSALAWKSLVPRAGEQLSVWSIGLVGAALSVGSRAWLDGYAGFMVVLGTLLVPVGGVLLAHFFVLKVPTDVAALYAPPAGSSRFPRAGLLAWALGGAAYHAGTPVGGTLPALIASAAAYTVLARWDARRRRRHRDVQESRGTPAR